MFWILCTAVVVELVTIVSVENWSEDRHRLLRNGHPYTCPGQRGSALVSSMSHYAAFPVNFDCPRKEEYSKLKGGIGL